MNSMSASGSIKFSVEKGLLVDLGVKHSKQSNSHFQSQPKILSTHCPPLIYLLPIE